MNSVTHCSRLQLRVLWQHYRSQSMPETMRSGALLEQLENQLGTQKLNRAIALVPNDPKCPIEALASNLRLLDVFYDRPYAFHALPEGALEWEPELLYQDGERGVIRIGGKLYGYQKDEIDELSEPPHPMMLSIQPGSQVTILTPHNQKRTGIAVMKGALPHSWILDMGGEHGTPAIATSENILQVEL